MSLRIPNKIVHTFRKQILLRTARCHKRDQPAEIHLTKYFIHHATGTVKIIFSDLDEAGARFVEEFRARRRRSRR